MTLISINAFKAVFVVVDWSAETQVHYGEGGCFQVRHSSTPSLFKVVSNITCHWKIEFGQAPHGAILSGETILANTWNLLAFRSDYDANKINRKWKRQTQKVHLPFTLVGHSGVLCCCAVHTWTIDREQSTLRPTPNRTSEWNFYTRGKSNEFIVA